MRLPQLLRMFVVPGVRHMIRSAAAVRRRSVSAFSPMKPNSIAASGTGESLKSDERSHTSGNDAVTQALKRVSTSAVVRRSCSSTSRLPKLGRSDVLPLAR